VVAKAPVPGRAKTRLGATVGMMAAAEVAAAALLDTVESCTEAFGAARCHLSVAGELADAVHGEELVRALAGWTVVPQQGDGFGERLAQAHAGVPGPVLQIGMDTPQVTASLLTEVAGRLASYDAVLGRAEDGGWWVLALRDPARADVLADVPMSTPGTHDATRSALVGAGLRVGAGPELRDVDEAGDADAVATVAPGTRFARAWSKARER
jgi:glycosyltransferase A (GT-A) superfamily protein (DUF2064 family)